MSIRNELSRHFSHRPWWLNAIWLFCLYMTFIYMPWDIFWKPYERWEEVWFGFTLHGWYAKLSEPLHWAIYAAGSYGIWKMRSWMWPWMSIYIAQIAIAMLVFSYLQGSAREDGLGRGLIVGSVTFCLFSYLSWLCWKLKPLFVSTLETEASANGGMDDDDPKGP
jgi:hypothetical protein